MRASARRGTITAADRADRRRDGSDLSADASWHRAAHGVCRWRNVPRSAHAKQPMMIVGQGALRRPDGAAVLAAVWAIAARVGALTADWHGFNVLHTAAARVGALDLGFLPGPHGKSFDAMLDGVDVLWLLGADEFDTERIARRHVRHLPGPSRRRRRGARRRDPAWRRLHRKVRHLRQHRRPCAARLRGDASAGRGARGLEDHSRVQRPDRSHLALRYDRSAARAAGAGQPGVRQSSAFCRASAAPTPPAPPAARGQRRAVRRR